MFGGPNVMKGFFRCLNGSKDVCAEQKRRGNYLTEPVRNQFNGQLAIIANI